MSDFIHPLFTLSHLLQCQGYHLQVFTSGRAKISLQTDGMAKQEFYTARPKRDFEAFARQKARSGACLNEHFKRVEELLDPTGKGHVFRVHEKGNNNATADNAHVVASKNSLSLWLVLDTIVHEWRIPVQVLGALISGTGPKVGAPSIFNEYMPGYEHDWQDAVFTEEDYRAGLREGALPKAVG